MLGLRRFGMPIVAVVVFNAAMVALAATRHESADAVFVAAWIAGDFVVSLIALALTDER